MLILAMESSAKPASVAICSDGVLIGQYFQNSGLTHSRTLLAMAEALLRNLDLTVKDIGLVAVSNGPGSFTGVRIGVSAAKGIAWGLDIPVCGVSTLEAMAYQVTGTNALLCPVMDARRSQVYNALFEWRDGTLARLCEDRAISLEDLAAGLAESQTPQRPDPPGSRSPDSDISAPIVLIGDGAEISRDYLAATGIPCRIAPDLLRWQTAYGVALAALHAGHIPAVELEPTYLRPSQAERESNR